MDDRKCLTCNKILAANSVSDKCSLCAIGLTPPAEGRRVELKSSRATRNQTDCEQCGAELSANDLRAGNCPICHHVISKPSAVKAEREEANAEYHLQEAGAKEWPTEAPLW